MKMLLMVSVGNESNYVQKPPWFFGVENNFNQKPPKVFIVLDENTFTKNLQITEMFFPFFWVGAFVLF